MNYLRDIGNLYQEILLEFSEGAIKKIVQKFSNEASENEIRREIQDFEKYKGGLQQKDPFQYQSWIEFTEAIHAAKGKAEFKNKKIPDESQITSTDDIIADDENVTIYKGDSQDKCVMYGRGYTFCISRPAGGNMFYNYRLGKESTFYFIYFKKKPKSDTDHIMVLDHTKHGYEWTFADNRTQKVKGGWDEIVSDYPELKPYERLLINKKLDDDERNFMDKLKNFTITPTLESFNSFSYKEKAQALKSIIDLPDDIWKTLDSTLRNEFLSVGSNLTKYQVDDLKPNEIERYKKTRNQSFEDLILNNTLKFNKYDSLENIVSNAYNSYQYAAHRLSKGLDVPSIIIDTIASDADLSFKYAYENLRGIDVPSIIIKKIASDPYIAFNYINDILQDKDVPEIFHYSISKVPRLSYNYATNILNGKQIPESILKSIASDTYFSYDYADFLNWKNVPDIIIKTILSNPADSYHYAIYNTSGKRVDDLIIKNIASDPDYAYNYAEFLKWKNVPKSIIQSIKNSEFAEYIPKNFTIKESITFTDFFIKKYPI